jgi:hypothetical protein
MLWVAHIHACKNNHPKQHKSNNIVHTCTKECIHTCTKQHIYIE